jgi:prepilin-type processing-associated H-X9-DG protein
MIRMNRVAPVLCLLSLTLLATSLRAQPADDVSPLLDAKTLLVARIDIDRFDLKGLQPWLRERMLKAGVPQDDVDGAGAAIGFIEAAFGDIKAKLAAAGVKRVYLVGTSDGLFGADGPPVFAAIRADEAAAAKIAEAIGIPDPDRRGRIGAFAVFGEPKLIAAAKAIQPAPRADLTAPLAAAGDASVVTVFSPDETARKSVEELSPTLPAELGGGPVTALTRGLKHATLALTTPPQFRLDVTVQAADAGGAAKLLQIVDKILAMAAKEEPAAADGLKLLRPTLAGDRLTLSMDTPAADRLFAALKPALEKARATAKATQSASNLRQIGMAVMMYANDNQGALPANFAALTPNYLPTDEVFANPRDPARGKQAYVYVKPAEAKLNDVKDASQRVLAYEAHDAFPPLGVNVLFLDGHCELIADEAAFKQLLGK